MDPFTENLLTRARERQKILQNYNETPHSGSPSKKMHSSEPLLNKTPDRSESPRKSNSEGNFTKTYSPTTRISSDFTTSKILNIQKDNLNMEIKVSSVDNVRVEVQIEEESEIGLRKDAKNRLNRLGKLYAGGEDADISSPIHQTESKFLLENSPRTNHSDENPPKRGLSKLQDLAQHFNEFEDDLSHVRIEPSQMKKSKKPPAPQPPRSPHKPPAPQPPSNKSENLKWDKKVLDSLESQGFTRTDSKTRLIYKYDNKTEKENVEKKQGDSIANRIGIFETNATSNKAVNKDPALLSVSERKALFEKNKGTPLIPKAAFAMATPVEKSAEVVKKPVSPVKQQQPGNVSSTFKSGGIANKVAALFENKSTISQEQIERNVQAERRKEMDMLLNRFHKPEEKIEEEAEPYEEDATEKTAMLETEKPAKIVEKRRSSGNKRCSQADSPKVAAILSDVKRIKVAKKAGRLYPSLTDIESTTETENEGTRSPSPQQSSADSSSIADSDDANTSFGRDILKAVCNKSKISNENNSDLSDVLDDMDDDYIDEALAYQHNKNQGRTSPIIETSNSFNYKSYNPDFKSPNKKSRVSMEKVSDLPTHVVEGDSVMPLTHTVSFYRKQQSSTSNTPVRQISRQPISEEPETPRQEIQEKIAEMKKEITKQEMIISQTSQALNLCNSTFEFMGSTEQVEAERVLLVATHRRQAALHEKQRLEVERNLRPRRGEGGSPPQKGVLNITKIVLPLKQKYVTALAAAGGKGHHVVCLLKYGSQVLSTPLVSTIATNSKNPELELYIPGTLKLNDFYTDLTVTFEVYCLQAQEEVLPHDVKYHIKKPNTPKKTKQDVSRLVRPIRESPAGPQAVRSPTFALMGYMVFTVPSALNKKHWTLNNTPSMSPLEGLVDMNISCDLEVSVEHRGFLTMFEDVSGFGAWHRRWCLLKGDNLSYWKYPDDEKKTPPTGSISLKETITKKIGPVSRDICARLHTFLIEIERDATPYDKESLVTIRKGPKTIIRHLLSADTKEERVEWCNKFNSVLSALTVTRNN